MRPAPNDAWNVAPELAVEVVSENNTANEIQEKIQDYFRCGVRNVWVVYPMQAQVFVYESPTQIKVVEQTDALDGGELLPGLRLPLDTLFATVDGREHRYCMDATRQEHASPDVAGTLALIRQRIVSGPETCGGTPRRIDRRRGLRPSGVCTIGRAQRPFRA